MCSIVDKLKSLIVKRTHTSHTAKQLHYGKNIFNRQISDYNLSTMQRLI
jgi:hypothetical protein